MIPNWLALATVTLLLALLIRSHLRARTLQAQLDALRAGPAHDIDRLQRSQYFARIGTWDWHIDTEQLYWSDAIYAMFGYQVGEVTPSYERFCAAVHPDDRVQVREGELRCIATGINHDEEYRVVWPDGSIHWLRETGNIVRNADGVAVRMMGVVRDITEEKARASELQEAAFHDALTGLPNRLGLERHLSRAIDQAGACNHGLALVFLDLNGFKAINDQFGHTLGDQVLILAAKRLKQMLRPADTVARIGGDEFVLILETPAANPDADLQGICTRILDALATPMALADGTVQVGASLGIALYPQHGTRMDALIHCADMAMYEAKRSGNNQFRLGAMNVA